MYICIYGVLYLTWITTTHELLVSLAHVGARQELFSELQDNKSSKPRRLCVWELISAWKLLSRLTMVQLILTKNKVTHKIQVDYISLGPMVCCEWQRLTPNKVAMHSAKVHMQPMSDVARVTTYTNI